MKWHAAPRANSPMRTWGRSASIRLLLAGAGLLLLACIVLSLVTHQQLTVLQNSADASRAQLLADDFAERISDRLRAGHRLTEPDVLAQELVQRLQTRSDLQSITLTLPDGSTLWTRAKSHDSAALTIQASSKVLLLGRQVASVQITLLKAASNAFSARAFALLLPVVVILSTLAFLAARVGESQGIQLRNNATRLAIRSIRNGHYDRWYVIPQRRGFDSRVHVLGHVTRLVHETSVRLRQLIASLRSTEPDAAGREHLDWLLRQAHGQDHFTRDGHAPRRIMVMANPSQAFLTCLLIALTSMTLPTLAAHALDKGALLSAQQQLPFYPLLFALGACLGAYACKRLRWSPVTSTLTACAVLCVLGATWATGWLESSATVNAVLATQCLCGICAGATFQACVLVHNKSFHDPANMNPGPRWAATVTGAWSLALLWIAPSLAAVASSALGPHFASAVMLIPVLVIAALVMVWNTPSSPWRDFYAGASVHADGLHRRDLPKMLAAFVIGAMAAMFNLLHASGLVFYLSSMLGTGLLIGLTTSSTHTRRATFVALSACALWLLNVLLREDSLAHNVAACAGGAAIGYAAGFILKAGSRRVESPALLYLVPAACGALVTGTAAWAMASASMLALACAGVLGVGAWLHMTWQSRQPHNRAQAVPCK